ncbi:amidase [Scopulibacillus darangshiensis]|nr:amidase [Scopulibacillus darangshiensis]
MAIKELVDGYRSKRFSPVEITKDYLKQIKAADRTFNIFITVTEEIALNQAEIAERKVMAGDGLDILQGVPFSYKDSIDTKGIRTTNGSLVDKNRIPSKDAKVIKILNDVGAVNLGKTNMYEYAFGITSDNPFYGPVRNPWDTRLTAGGSSGGSAAAVAANLCMGSIGTDTAGSIRVPSSCCGVVGLKPTYGLIDMKGITPLSWSLDHAGPIARNVTDLALVMEALTNKPFGKSCIPDIKGMRVGIPKQHFNERIAVEIRQIYHKAVLEFERLGAVLVEIDLPFAAEALGVASTVATAEVGYVHKDRMKSSINLYSDGAKKVFKTSQSISSFSYIEAMNKREKMSHQLTELYNYIDVIVTPTLPAIPTEIGANEVQFPEEREDVEDCMIRFTCLFNITGHPTLSIPCGLTDKSIPVGLQIIANHHREDLLLRAAFTYEQTALLDFYSKRDMIFSNEIKEGGD